MSLVEGLLQSSAAASTVVLAGAVPTDWSSVGMQQSKQASKQLHRRILRTKSSNKEMHSKGACHNFGGKTGRPTAKRRRDKCIQQDQKRKKTFQKGPCESHFASHCYYLLYELVSTGQVLTRPTLERLYVPLSEGSRLKFREIADETEKYRVGLTRRVT